MTKRVQGYWLMTWLGLLANVSSLPIIGIVAFGGAPLQTLNVSLAFSIAWPAAIVGIVASAGLLADKKWGVILAIISISMVVSSSLSYAIIRSIVLKENEFISNLSLMMGLSNLVALIYWCRPSHRKNRRL